MNNRKSSLTHAAMLGCAAAFQLLMASPAQAQEETVQGFVHQQSEASGYVWPTDEKVLQKIDEWQDLKFGVLFHWGLYAVPGIVESWSICSEDEDWISRKENLPYDDYKKWYFGLSKSFNPVNFDPQQWARVMQDAGMKYMIFTTKHHDGFCLYDSRYTDFSVARGPFAGDARRDVLRHVLDAFRAKNFMVGEYFSKPDWHCPWFWNPEFATADRHINYKRERHPQWWANYQTFTQNQLRELTSNYGPVDILWLDGGWIKGEDINLDGILAEARQKHPGLIAVDRAVKGHNENYQTPERGVPDHQLDYPWESNIPLSNDWGWVPNAPYKSAQRVVNILIEITAKGGNFLLGVGPTADGLIEQPVVDRLHQVGQWLRTNGEAIYGTRNAAIYHQNNVWFTAHKNGRTLYALYALPEGESLPEVIEWEGNVPRGKMVLLQSGRRVSYSVKNGRVSVRVPHGTKAEPLAFRFEPKGEVSK